MSKFKLITKYTANPLASSAFINLDFFYSESV